MQKQSKNWPGVQYPLNSQQQLVSVSICQEDERKTSCQGYYFVKVDAFHGFVGPLNKKAFNMAEYYLKDLYSTSINNLTW